MTAEPIFSRLIRWMPGLGRSWRRDRRGNVLMLFALSIIPLVFATGMGIDYARAMRLQTKLNAAADAAALAAVSRQAMNYLPSVGQAAAYQMFVTQTQALTSGGGLVINYLDPTQLTITVTQTQSSNGASANVTRIATVSYRAKSTNAFPSILGLTTLTIKGTSATTASTAPNIDFYVMMDTSPSMLLPATSNGLSVMISATGGCAFACHQTNSTSDNYSIARKNNIVLRTDLVSQAVQDLTTTAAKIANQNNTTYRMGLSDFDYMFRQIWPTKQNSDGSYVDSNLTTVQSHVADAAVLTYCANNYRVCSTSDNDTATNQTAGFQGVSAQMPTPGNGTGQSGDMPQEVLFVITDGMRDELSGSSRIMGPIPSAICTAIKNRNIRIAILDTQYLPASASDSWSITNVRTPYLSPTDKITPALTACASPGLFYQVTTDSDISAALSQLFQTVVATAHITQ